MPTKDVFDFQKHESYHQSITSNTKIPSKFVMSIKTTSSVNSGHNSRRDLL